MVSPYLLRPLRSLEEVLETAHVQAARRELPRGAFMAARGAALGVALGSETAAATLRRQGRLKRPRVVWINETEDPARDD